MPNRGKQFRAAGVMLAALFCAHCQRVTARLLIIGGWQDTLAARLLNAGRGAGILATAEEIQHVTARLLRSKGLKIPEKQTT